MSAIGVSVPWNAMWTGEQQYEIRPCRWAEGKLAIWSPHQPGTGTPIYAKPHMVRQRRSIAKFLCTVCGEHAPPGDRWWFGLGHFSEGWFMTTEAPVHQACGTLASRVCPHLRTLKPDMRPFPKTYSVLSAVVGGPRCEDDFGVSIAGRTVIGHLKFGWPENELLKTLRAPSAPLARLNM